MRLLKFLISKVQMSYFKSFIFQTRGFIFNKIKICLMVCVRAFSVISIFRILMSFSFSYAIFTSMFFRFMRIIISVDKKISIIGKMNFLINIKRNLRIEKVELVFCKFTKKFLDNYEKWKLKI